MIKFLIFTLLMSVVPLTAAVAPTIINQHESTVPGVSVQGALTASPVTAGDTLGYQIYSGPFYGSITLDATSGAYTYVPLATSSGVVDPLGIRVTDQMGRSSTAILSVHITGPNDVRQIVISRPADEFVYVGSPWIYVITVDSSLLSPTSQSNQFSLPIAPFGTTITQLTGNQAQIRFQPTTGQVGINHLAIKCVDQVSHACCLQQIPIVVLNGAPQ